MSNPQSVTLSVDNEYLAVGNGLKALIGDIKAGKAVTQIATDSLVPLITAVGDLQNLSADAGHEDNIAYLTKCLASALLPVPAVPAAK